MEKVVVFTADDALFNFCQNLNKKNILVKQVARDFATLMNSQCGFDLVLFDFSLLDSHHISDFDAVFSNSHRVPIIALAKESCFNIAISALVDKVERVISMPCSIGYLHTCLDIHSQEKLVTKMSDTAFEFPNTFIGTSEQIVRLKEKVLLLAKGDFPVLILGETGTGKSCVARLIHEFSGRKNYNFVEENLSAIQETLIEGELFGTKSGAYTGAVNRSGLFESAHKGTLFLDEIACIKNTIQAKLLQVLETGQYRIVGSLENRCVDVRLISATNTTIQNLKDTNFFRSDLYYRISSMQLFIPPLRERKEDILVLTKYFLHQLFEKTGTEKKMSSDALLKLEKHNWLGNVREVKHCIECAFYLSSSQVIFSSDLSFIS